MDEFKTKGEGGLSIRRLATRIFGLPEAFKSQVELGPDSSSYSIESETKLRKISSPEVNALSKRRMHEVETQRAFVMALSRHERWKGGGPI